MIDTTELQINRIIIHRVHKKRDEEDFGFAEYSENLFSFGALELETLKDRIATAFSKTKRFFKLEIAQSENNSFYGYSRNLKGCSASDFITHSKSITDLLAISHSKKDYTCWLIVSS